MRQVSWVRTGPVPWLVTGRPEGAPSVAGVSFGVGSFHQPVPDLGVAALLAAWLTANLSRPVESLPGEGQRPDQPAARVAFSLGLIDSALVVSGGEDQVADALRRFDDLVAAAAAGRAEIDDSLRDRARAYPSPLLPWLSHLAARWPGHAPLLTALGPLALDTVDAADVARYARDQVLRAPRVHWTNDPRVAEVVRLEPGSGSTAGLAAPQGLRRSPGCVLRRGPNELGTVVLADGAAARVGLSLLARHLHRRLVEFEPLAAEVRLSRYEVGGGLVLVTVEADLLPGKGTQARAAVVDTVTDLGAGAVAADEIDRVRAALADAERATDVSAAQPMLSLAGRHLHGQEYVTPETLAGDYAAATDDDIRSALAGLPGELLLAMPSAEAGSAPYPLVGPLPPGPAKGRRYPGRLNRYRYVRCSDSRVAIVETVASGGRFWSTARPVTRAGVDFADVILRVDAGDEAAALVDRNFAEVELVWAGYRKGHRLRAEVDRRTAGVPVIRQPPDPEWAAQLAGALKAERRRAMTGAVVVGALFAVLIALIVIGTGLNPRPTDRTVNAGETVTLGNGATLGIVGNPELITHYNAYTPSVYAVQVRMCGGDGSGNRQPRNYFGAEKFQLLLGEQTPVQYREMPERPAPRGDYVREGECATGWVLFRLPTADLAVAPVLRYTNLSEDRVMWRLPAGPAESTLSKPCPTARPGVVPWQGC